MEFTLSKLIASLFLPPTGLVFLGILGVGLSLIWKKLGTWVAGISLLGLLLCSIPVVAGVFVNSLQTYPALSENELKSLAARVDAIVVLAGGRREDAQEFGGDTISELSLERLRYAAWLAKRTGLPLIVSGGRLNDEDASLAELMREILQKEFIVIVDAVEEKSRTTYENAQYTAEILRSQKMKKIFLVTHAWHMPRAVKAFEHFDIEVVPAPTAFYGRNVKLHLYDFLPSADALNYTSFAFHEFAGELWYEVRYY